MASVTGLAFKDADIIRHFARYVHLTPLRLAQVTGRGVGARDPGQTMRKRLQRLRDAGMVESLSLPDERFGENVSRLTSKGWTVGAHRKLTISAR